MHSLRVATSLHPRPLHEFWPLQEEVAVLQALVPLQELIPPHFTPSPAEATGARAAANNAAADATRSRR
jgi:hypothetical protein